MIFGHSGALAGAVFMPLISSKAVKKPEKNGRGGEIRTRSEQITKGLQTQDVQ
jgi:hypothetical protein